MLRGGAPIVSIVVAGGGQLLFLIAVGVKLASCANRRLASLSSDRTDLYKAIACVVNGLAGSDVLCSLLVGDRPDSSCEVLVEFQSAELTTGVHSRRRLPGCRPHSDSSTSVGSEFNGTSMNGGQPATSIDGGARLNLACSQQPPTAQ